MIWLALKARNWSPATLHDHKVTVRFVHIGGLTMMAPVILAAVAIGRIASIGMDSDDSSTRVTFPIGQAEDNLSQDTSATMLTSSVFGVQEFGWVRGLKKPIEITQSAVVLEHLIGQI